MFSRVTIHSKFPVVFLPPASSCNCSLLLPLTPICRFYWVKQCLVNWLSMLLAVSGWVIEAWPLGTLSGPWSLLLCLCPPALLPGWCELKAALFFHTLSPWCSYLEASLPWTESLETASQIKLLLLQVVGVGYFVFAMEKPTNTTALVCVSLSLSLAFLLAPMHRKSFSASQFQEEKNVA